MATSVHARGLREIEDEYGGDRPVPSDRPWVLANMVTTLDGSAAVGGRVGPLSSPPDRALFVALRAAADVVMVGAGTVRAERYGPVVLSGRWRVHRVAQGRPPVPVLAVVTRSLDLDWDAPLFRTDGDDGPRPLVITTTDADPQRLAVAGDRADVVLAGTGKVDLQAALAALARRGAGVVLTEGGPVLLGELAGVGLLDELCLTIAPFMGGDPLPIARRPASEDPLVSFTLTGQHHEGDQVFLRYLVRR